MPLPSFASGRTPLPAVLARPLFSRALPAAVLATAAGFGALGVIGLGLAPADWLRPLAIAEMAIATVAVGLGAVLTIRALRSRERALLGHRQNQARLDAALGQFTALWEKSPLSIILFEPNDPQVPVKILDCNPMACEMHGYRREELIGQCVDIIEATPWTQWASSWLGELREKRRLEGRGQHRRKDGTVFDTEYFTSLVVLEGRELVIGMDRDATAARQAERALHANEAELRRAKEAAESADRAKSEFLAVMSHEIRTPMNGVIGFTNLLLDTPLAAEQRDWLLTIRTSGESLLSIINDILDFSKIESGRMELDRHPVCLRRCIEEVLDLLWSKASERELELVHWIEPDVPEWITGDGTRLRQVLVNLVGNAIKFTARGEVVLRAACAPARPGEPPLVAVTIQDSGEGIPADRIARLFRPFSQADSSTTRRFGGTGLGLAISRSLAQLLGGDLELVSTSPQGSCFRFTFVAPPAAAPEDEPARARVAQPAVPLDGRRALIVDDNAANRRILAGQLERWGLVCHACADPAEAIAYLRQPGPTDIALLDMMMPDMNGLELAAALHGLPDRHDLPLVLLSSISREELRPLGPENHFRVVLTKPVRQAALLEAVQKALAGSLRPAGRSNAPMTVPVLNGALGRQHPLRILVAEDNAVNQKLIIGLLHRLGYKPRLVENGQECLEALRAEPFDLVLLDCQMPVMDGYAAVGHIRAGEAGERHRDVPVIALTASAMSGDRERCLQAGMSDYLTKPIQAPALVQLIEATAVSAA